MDKKARNQMISEYSYQVEIMDDSIEELNNIMNELVDDTSEPTVGHILFMSNTKEDIRLDRNMVPLLLKPETIEDMEDVDKQRMIGITIPMSDPVLYTKTIMGAIPLEHKIYIGVLSKIKKDLVQKRKTYEAKLNKVIQDK